MASPRSVDSSVDVEDVPVSASENIKKHIRKLSQSIDVVMKLSKHIHEARGAGALKPGKKIKFDDNTTLGIEDLNSQISEIKRNLKIIPRMVKEAERKPRRKNTNHKPQPPCLFRKPLLDFFNAVDLGEYEGQKLQKHKVMEYFFTYGICNLTFGVSIFNVWGNIYKRNTGNTKVYLDERGRAMLKDALAHLKVKYTEALSRDGATELELSKARDDLARLETGELQNKDYMPIFAFYRETAEDKKIPDDKKEAYAPAVVQMSEVTQALNTAYSAERNQRKAAAAAAEAPAPAPVPVPMPSVPKVTAPPAPVATVKGRGKTGR